MAPQAPGPVYSVFKTAPISLTDSEFVLTLCSPRCHHVVVNLLLMRYSRENWKIRHPGQDHPPRVISKVYCQSISVQIVDVNENISHPGQVNIQLGSREINKVVTVCHNYNMIMRVDMTRCYQGQEASWQSWHVMWSLVMLGTIGTISIQLL